MEKIKLLFVEDENDFRSIIKDCLEMTGEYRVTEAKNGFEGYEAFKSSDFDIIVTDVDMPKITGLELVDLIRKDSNVPILVASGLTNPERVNEGFKHDIDSYIKKPYTFEEIDGVIKALFKRLKNKNHIITEENKLLQFGSFTFDSGNRCLKHNDMTISLSKREAQILYLLLNNKGKLVKRSVILRQFWGSDDDPYHTRSLDVFITKLRNYLKDDKSVKIYTLRSEGFKLEF